MEFKLGTMSIFELGQFISSKLKEDGVTIQSELTVYVTSEEFKKIDEDLYYRNRKDESQEFIPSEGEIDINFELVKIIIKEKV
jgi:hypothetical protein